MVLEFAASARAKLNATWGIAELGAAGPAGTPYGHGPGVSVIGVVGPKSASRTIETGSSNRIENMNAFTKAGLELLAEVLGVSVDR